MNWLQDIVELRAQLPSTWAADKADRVCHWVTTDGSLTAALQQAAQGKLVHHLDQLGWMEATATDQQYWQQLQRGQRCWQRRIRFTVDDQNWLQARVIIPQSSLRGPAVALQYCGAKSLGSCLFTDPDLRRDPFQFCEQLSQDESDCVTRQAVYYFYQQPLLVQETFLPALLDLEVVA